MTFQANGMVGIDKEKNKYKKDFTNVEDDIHENDDALDNCQRRGLGLQGALQVICIYFPQMILKNSYQIIPFSNYSYQTYCESEWLPLQKGHKTIF